MAGKNPLEENQLLDLVMEVKKKWKDLKYKFGRDKEWNDEFLGDSDMWCRLRYMIWPLPGAWYRS